MDDRRSATLARTARRLAGAVVLVLTLVIGASHAVAEKRIALVIGNSGYANVPALRNPSNDAALMSATLRQVGFEVIEARDVDRRAMGRAIRDFGMMLRRAGRDAIGLFYYAGHGVQHNGNNYLLPLGAEIEFSSDLHLEALKVTDVLAQMADAGNALNLVILDACRNNPFPSATRSAVRGLARIPAVSGSLVAFAAAPGEAALDGDGSNSPYTLALSKAMATPGLAVEEVFKQARIDVLDRTGGAQTPWEESSLTGSFSFVPETASASAAPNASPADGTPSTAPGGREAETLFWDTVKDTDSPDMLRAYLEAYPDGIFAPIAAIMLSQHATAAPAPDTDEGTVSATPETPVKPQTGTAPVAETQDQNGETVVAYAPDAAVAPEPEPDPDLPRRLQSALADAGCRPGPIDGVWGRKSQRALEAFARHASLTLPDDALSAETLDLIEGAHERDGRICPLVCSARQEVRDGRCVTKSCPRGRVLNSRGRCVRPTRDTQRQRQQRPSSSTSPSRDATCTETQRRLRQC